LGKPLKWLCDNQGTNIIGDGIEIKKSWDLYYEAIITKKGILLYSQKNAFNWIPLGLLNSEDDFIQLKSLVNENVKKIIYKS